VIDRGIGGHQPFISGDGTVAASFNGEVYNHVELRTELAAEGVSLRTRSDTEVLVEGYRVWGHDVWRRLNGYWAVALLDLRDGTLALSRDRVGIAPLYYREEGDSLIFASLLRPLLRGPGEAVDRERARAFIDTALKDFDHRTFYPNVRSLSPGATLVLPRGALRIEEARRVEYWRSPRSVLSRRDIGLDEAAVLLRETLADAVRLRLRADRPMAFELSGGLDTSSLVALAAMQTNAPLTTYTARVPEADEEPLARALRDRFRLDYRVVDDVEAGFHDEAIPFAALMEEPYHAPSIYTHYSMRRQMKRAGVDVVLAGSGGDAILAGDEWDFWPAASRTLLANGEWINAWRYQVVLRYGTLPRARQSLLGWARWAVRSARHPLALARRVRGRIAGAVASSGPAVTADPALADGPDPAYALHASYGSLDYVAQRHYQLEVAQLPYYLRSNDHFTFSLPLEHRLPFLDHRVIELGLTMPPSYLFRDGWTKYVLRKAMDGLLPPAVAWRREKMGFPFPFRRFLRENRAAFLPLAERVAEAEITGPIDYDELFETDHHRLWRICSTGLWLASW